MFKLFRVQVCGGGVCVWKVCGVCVCVVWLCIVYVCVCVCVYGEAENTFSQLLFIIFQKVWGGGGGGGGAEARPSSPSPSSGPEEDLNVNRYELAKNS